ncbi:MAG: hypothetical protein N3G75_04675 [Methanothrix sp.]|nr:hypothetical protein [Methanothrix sp.]MCX8207110.1 hypothetical protein [Methanothrix sp.]
MNFERVYRRLSELSSGVSRDKLYELISIDHGANYSAMVFSSWVAFFVAFMYYLLPKMIPWLLRSGFPIASSYGLILFAGFFALLASLLLWASRNFPLWLRLSEIYRIYPIPLNQKKWCFAPVMLLWISSFLSIYNSISYPYANRMYEMISWLLLLAALILLFIPVFKEFVEASR